MMCEICIWHDGILMYILVAQHDPRRTTISCPLDQHLQFALGPPVELGCVYKMNWQLRFSGGMIQQSSQEEPRRIWNNDLEIPLFTLGCVCQLV